MEARSKKEKKLAKLMALYRAKLNELYNVDSAEKVPGRSGAFLAYSAGNAAERQERLASDPYIRFMSVASGVIEPSFPYFLRILPFFHPVASRSPTPEITGGCRENDLEGCFLQPPVSCPAYSIPPFEFTDCSFNGVAFFHALPVILSASTSFRRVRFPFAHAREEPVSSCRDRW